MALLAAKLIRDIPDFPKAGIIFKDITPVIADAEAFQEVVDKIVEYARDRKVDVVAGIESRGFIFGAPVALALGVGFVPVRKLGKLPGETVRMEYELEYGVNTVEMQKDGIQAGQRVLIVDDLLATGGTAAAAARLIEKLNGDVAGLAFMVELGFLNGRETIAEYEFLSLLEY